MKRFLTFILPAAALVLLGGQARADSITANNVTWTYNWEPGAPALFADTNPTASIAFTDEPQKAARGNSDVVATDLRSNSAAPGISPDTLNKNGAYALTLNLTSTDALGTHTATLTFHGTLNGTFSSESSNIANTFGPDASQTVSMGSFNFTVTMDAYTNPGPPDQKNSGSIGAHVSITSGEPVAVDHPEPSTLLLSGLGMTFLGVGAWRKRRAKARQARMA
jgi:hypothetical protein